MNGQQKIYLVREQSYGSWKLGVFQTLEDAKTAVEVLAPVAGWEEPAIDPYEKVEMVYSIAPSEGRNSRWAIYILDFGQWIDDGE